jgi:chromosome partitioning protein
MRRVAIASQKGGAGKTTTTVCLAGALAERGRRVLVLDADAQCNATAWLGVRPPGRGLYDVLADNAPIADYIANTAYPHIDCVGASPWMVGLDKAMATEPGGELTLRAALEALDGYDYLLIDTPPALGYATVAALCAVREVLAPCEPSVMAASGVARLLEAMDKVRARLNPELRLLGVLLTRARLHTRHARDVRELLRERVPVFATVIRDNVRIAEAWGYRQPITYYDGKSNGAADYAALADELEATT